MVYGFAEQLQKGEAAEARLDRYFSAWYEILPVSMSAQRAGIDRVYVDLKTGETMSVEIKADYKAAETGNAYIEMESVSTTNKPGWALSSKAHILVYFVPGLSEIITIKTATLRESLSRWERTYPTRKAQNETYHSTGVLVPLDELRAIAIYNDKEVTNEN